MHDGLSFALCWRCSGIYLGVAAAALLVLVRTRGLARIPTNGSAIVCVTLMLPLLIDGWGQALGLWQTGAAIRFATGWALGISLPPLCMPLLTRPRASFQRSIGRADEWLILISAGVVAWVSLRTSSDTMAISLRAIVNLGQLFLLVTILAAILLPLLRRSPIYSEGISRAKPLKR